MVCTVTELFQKEVINIDNAEKVGFISDMEIDIFSGEIVSICVFSGGGFIKPKNTVKICRKDIVKIGAHTVLVKNVPAPAAKQGSGKLRGFLSK